MLLQGTTPNQSLLLCSFYVGRLTADESSDTILEELLTVKGAFKVWKQHLKAHSISSTYMTQPPEPGASMHSLETQLLPSLMVCLILMLQLCDLCVPAPCKREDALSRLSTDGADTLHSHNLAARKLCSHFGDIPLTAHI